MPNLPVQRFGMEIESYIPDNLEDALCKRLDALDCDYSGDGSIVPPSNGNFQDIEIKTPPLTLKEFNQFSYTLDKTLKKYKVKANTSCGIHVHVSHPKFFKRGYLKRIAYTWLAVEDVLFSMQNARRINNQYCARSYYDYVNRGGLPKFGNSRRDFKRGNFTYPRNALNFGALREHGTIECRLHRGTTDIVRLRNWVYLLNQFYDYCLNNYDSKDIITLLKMDCSDEKAKLVWKLLDLDKKRTNYFNRLVNPKLFGSINKQSKNGLQAKTIKSKIKWYKNRFKINKTVDWNGRKFSDGTWPQTTAEKHYFELINKERSLERHFRRDIY